MATGVNVKMGVSGVSQFKNNMNQSKQAVKTLDAQLALTEKQFKQTGDSESYMSEKAELLKAKLEQQKSVVSNAEKALEQMREKGVDTSSKSYQDLYRQMIQAKGAMIDTENELNGIADAGADAATEVSTVNDTLTHIGKGVDYQNVTDGISKITGTLEKAAQKAWQLGEAIVKSTLGAGTWADELKTTAAQMSTAEHTVTPEELQRMRKTATIIDTDVETIVAARAKLYKDLGKGDKSALSGLIDTDGKDNIDIFWEAGEAILNMKDNVEQENAAQKIFGKSWKDLIPLFQAGRKEYDETMESWSVVENDQIDALGKMDDQYQKMTAEWETFKMELLSAFSGPLTEGMETITGLFQELNKYLDTPEGQAMLQQIGETVSGLITDLTQINPEEVVGGFTDIVNGVTSALQWIDEHHQDVVTALEVIAAGWAALKITGGVLEILKIVNAISGLVSGSEAAAAGAAAGSSWAGAFASAAMKAAPFLAFLYTLLNPGNTSDKIGDNTLVDENGKLTTEAETYGYKLDDEGNLEIGEVPEQYTKESTAPTIDLTTEGIQKRLKTAEEWTLSDDLTAEEIMELVRASEKMEETAADAAGKNESLQKSTDDMKDAAEDMSKTAKGLPTLFSRILNGVKVEIDGEEAGRLLAPYVSMDIAADLE